MTGRARRPDKARAARGLLAVAAVFTALMAVGGARGVHALPSATPATSGGAASPAASAASVVAAPAAPVLREERIGFSTSTAEVSGTLVLVPTAVASRRIPCVLIVGGSMSQGRNGECMATGAPPRDALKRLSDQLVRAGYSTYRFDRPGFGASKAREGWRNSYAQQAEIAASALAMLRGRPEFSTVVAVGESAGAYVLSRAAAAGAEADGYVFLGALCGSTEELYDYNFGRFAREVAGDAELSAWAEASHAYELALAAGYKDLLAAARAGAATYELKRGEFTAVEDLTRRAEELATPPDAAFRAIRKPTLALAGERDRNVPPHHAARAVAIMQEAGNLRAQSRVIPLADHSFQRAPGDPREQLRERFNLRSFLRPYAPELYKELLAWLTVEFPPVAAGDPGRIPPVMPPVEVRARDRMETDTVQGARAARLHLAPGVEVIRNVLDAKNAPGVETPEGRIGALILGEGQQAHYIDMPPGTYVEEHGHSSESLIYTVRGRWVLCSAGRRVLMEPGSLFRFGPNMATGYEVPFGEPALILIFKGDRETRSEAEFAGYLRGFSERVGVLWKKGERAYRLWDLPKDHPARVFARSVNPGADSLGPSTAPAAKP